MLLTHDSDTPASSLIQAKPAHSILIADEGHPKGTGHGTAGKQSAADDVEKEVGVVLCVLIFAVLFTDVHTLDAMLTEQCTHIESLHDCWFVVWC